MAAKTNDDYALVDEHQVRIQIGSKLTSEYPINSVTESLHQLKKRVDVPRELLRALMCGNAELWLSYCLSCSNSKFGRSSGENLVGSVRLW